MNGITWRSWWMMQHYRFLRFSILLIIRMLLEELSQKRKRAYMKTMVVISHPMFKPSPSTQQVFPCNFKRGRGCKFGYHLDEVWSGAKNQDLGKSNGRKAGQILVPSCLTFQFDRYQASLFVYEGMTDNGRVS